jgi:hypothetical protein
MGALKGRPYKFKIIFGDAEFRVRSWRSGVGG